MHKLSFPYLLGLFETDGSFHIVFKRDASMPIGYRLQPEVQWSQKSTHLLKDIVQALHQRGILARLYSDQAQVRGGRAPCVRIRGISNVRAFLEACAEERQRGGAELYGQKRLDYLLMVAIYTIIDSGAHNTPRGRQEIIDLKFALHKMPAEIYRLPHRFFQDRGDAHAEPLKDKRPVSRAEWERRHSLGEGSSLNSAIALKRKAHEQYKSFASSVIAYTPLLVPGYVSALLEGDGCLYVNPNRARECLMSFVCERGSELLIVALAHYLGDLSPAVYYNPSKSARYYVVRRGDLLSTLCKHLQSCPILYKTGPQSRFLECCKRRNLVL